MLPETFGTESRVDDVFDASACSSLTDLLRLAESQAQIQSDLRKLCELCELCEDGSVGVDVCRRGLLRARAQHRSFRGILEWECATRWRRGLLHALVHDYVTRALQRQAFELSELAWSFRVGEPNADVIRAVWAHAVALRIECALLAHDVTGT